MDRKKRRASNPYVIRETQKEHFILIVGSQLRQYNDRPLSTSITPVVYGEDFDNLATFLEQLRSEEEINVSQDPRYYEKRSASRPGPFVFGLARLAKEKLESALDALQGADRAMQQVEIRDAMSRAMNGLGIEDRETAHEYLADLLAEPVEHVRSCAEEVVAAFQRAEPDVWRLTAPSYVKHAVPLIADMVAGLEEASAQLSAKVVQARDEFDDRQVLSIKYRDFYKGMDQACRSIDQARKIAVSLSDGIRRGRSQEVQAAGSSAAVPLIPTPEPSATATGQSRAAETDWPDFSMPLSLS